MKIIDLLRLSESGLSQRALAASAGCGKTTIVRLQRRFCALGLTYAAASGMSDEELHRVLYPEKAGSNSPQPNWSAVHEELVKHKNLNLRFLWEEYRVQHPAGMSYSRFCERYRTYREASGREVSLYHERRAGEIMEVDWMGKTLPCVVDSATGEVREAHFFVAVLGYSHYPYVEAFPHEREPNWIAAHVNALSYYGGVPRTIVPDNCKTAVKTPKYIEPTVNSAYWELAQHYEVAVVPARARKPKDKPVVEQSVGWLQTWLLGKLRNQTFFSFHELNAAIRTYLRELSDRPFQKRDGSRQSEFAKVDKPALRPLPAHKYELADVKLKRVGDNYHLEYDGFHYSVPYTLHKQQVILRATHTTVEVLDTRRTRVASHVRQYSAKGGRYVTNVAHMPPHHRAVHEARGFDGRRYRAWAKSVGENTRFIIDGILSAGKVEEQGYRACMALLQLTRTYGNQRLEAACKRARQLGSHTYTTVKTLLKNGLEEAPPTGAKPTPGHENIRGGAYYS
jgi:transposase